MHTHFSAVVVDVKLSEVENREGSQVMVLTCEVYGYPRDSSPPKWASSGRDLTTDRFNTSLSNTDKLLSNSSVSSEESVVLQLTSHQLMRESTHALSIESLRHLLSL